MEDYKSIDDPDWDYQLDYLDQPELDADGEPMAQIDNDDPNDLLNYWGEQHPNYD